MRRIVQKPVPPPSQNIYRLHGTIKDVQNSTRMHFSVENNENHQNLGDENYRELYKNSKAKKRNIQDDIKNHKS